MASASISHGDVGDEMIGNENMARDLKCGRPYEPLEEQ